MKTCVECKQSKPLASFHADKRRRDGHHPVCKDCKSAYDRKYHSDNREARLLTMRNNALLKRFGLTAQDYDEMLAAQGGTCAICPATAGYGGKRLAVDHDHATGRVRAILCDRCNQILGMAKDDPELLARCAEYISLRIVN